MNKLQSMRLPPQTFRGQVNTSSFKTQVYDKLNAQGNTIGFPTSSLPQYYEGKDPRRTPKYVQITAESQDILKKTRKEDLQPQTKIPEIPFAMTTNQIHSNGNMMLILIGLIVLGLFLVLKNS